MAETKKILLVEDDNNLREIYGARLQAEGYEIVAAADGESALAVAVKEKPDLIISDVMMPRVSGFDMLDILRNAPETRDTKVIMMTALSQAEDKARADKLGADMYLVKSQVTLEDVTKAVHKILDGPTESDQEEDSAAAQKMVSGDQSKPEQAAVTEAQAPVNEESSPTVAQEPVQTPPTPQAEAQPDPTPQTDTSAATPKVEEPPAPQPQPAPAASEPVPVAEPPKAPADAATPSAPDTVETAAQDGQPQAAPTTTTQDDKPTIADPQTTDQPTEDATTGPDTEDLEASPGIGPNLAQALEDEEKSLQDKIDNFEQPKPEASPVEQPQTDPTSPPTMQESALSNTVTPPPTENPSTATEETVQKPSTEEAATPTSKNKPDILDDRPTKKVIEPINDLSKGPDINALIAKEEEAEAAKANQANDVIKPQAPDNTPGQGGEETQTLPPKEHPGEDFGKISL